jgi:hypothetical protein
VICLLITRLQFWEEGSNKCDHGQIHMQPENVLATRYRRSMEHGQEVEHHGSSLIEHGGRGALRKVSEIFGGGYQRNMLI